MKWGIKDILLLTFIFSILLLLFIATLDGYDLFYSIIMLVFTFGFLSSLKYY